MKKVPDSAASKILVIDDDADFRQVIIRYLFKQGYTVVGASDGMAGAGLAAETLPDLIVCDLNMPGMDGYAVLAALRRDPKLADIPLIFLTGQSQPSQVRQGMNLGADDYLTKPVSLEDLLGAVKVRLSRRQTQRQRQEKQMERAMQLFGGIVHDLRDPLFVVLGYTGMLRGGAGQAPGGGEYSRQILDRMQQAALRMQAIVSETLFLARSRMQKLPFDPGPLDLREFCEQLVAEHEESRRLRFQCAGEWFAVTADALRLRQALECRLRGLRDRGQRSWHRDTGRGAGGDLRAVLQGIEHGRQARARPGAFGGQELYRAAWGQRPFRQRLPEGDDVLRGVAPVASGQD